jgi:CRP-like cAMP-binding protein
MRRFRGLAGQAGRANAAGKPVWNQILLSIPESEFSLIRPFLQFCQLSNMQILHEPNAKAELAYFVNSGLISLMIETREGKTVEVGIVGNEGIVGIAATVGISRSPMREVVQVAGNGFGIEVRALQSSLLSSPTLRALLNQRAVLQCLQGAQTAACNRLHSVEQRFARWLLAVQARSGSDSLAITHDFIAAILGTDRPSVSLAAGNFQRRHLIEYTRGAVKILNRKKLERLACECFAIIQQIDGVSDQPKSRQR